MISEHSTIKISDNALIQKVSDEMVILDSESGQYYTLNEVASDMLELLQKGKSISEVADSICGEYYVDFEEVESDLIEMVNYLIELKIASTS